MVLRKPDLVLRKSNSVLRKSDSFGVKKCITQYSQPATCNHSFLVSQKIKDDGKQCKLMLSIHSPPPKMSIPTNDGVRLAEESKKDYEFVFGFGSIMNSSTHAPWLEPSNNCSSEGAATMTALPGKVVRIRQSFGYERRWNFRSTTGFTALGVSRITTTADPPRDMNGVLFQIPSAMMPGFDRREVGYEKVRIPMDCIDFCSDGEYVASNNTNAELPELTDSDHIWIYVPQANQCREADENHPLLQSYVDTVMQGCLEWGGRKMAEDFVLSTGSWSSFFLNDTPSSRRPWLFRKDYDILDDILQKHSGLTHYADRRHPEEFASVHQFVQMRGLWSLPRRNRHFTGRDAALGQIHGRLNSNEGVGSGGVTFLFVQGMGGVGKSSICTEYCYRQFPTSYGLVVWLNAESTDALVADYRQLLADLADGGVDANSPAGNNTSNNKDNNNSTDEVIGEVKTRLFRCKTPWLLVFDNLEERKLLEKFVPRGAASGSKGHVLVTSRVVDMESDSGSSSLVLGCLSPTESVEMLRRALGSSGNALGNDPKELSAASEIAERLGNLPLALGMAAAYMQRCDVSCVEYVERYDRSEQSGRSLLKHKAGRVLDYSLTVSASLSLSLKAIAKENETASALLNLLCWLGPDQITKALLRGLLSAKRRADDEEKLLQDSSQLKAFPRGFALGATGKRSCVCGLIVGGGACILPFVRGHRTHINVFLVTALALSASVALACSTKKPYQSQTEDTNASPPRRTSSGSSGVDEFEQSDSVWQILKSFSILTVKEGKGSMHRLLAQSLRVAQTESESCYNLKICIEATDNFWHFDPKLSETWQESLHVVEHVKSLVSHVAQHERDICPNIGVRAGSLSMETGVFSAMALNGFIEAQASLELALKLFKKSTLKHDKKDSILEVEAEALHELGRVLRYQGNFAESQEHLLRALSIRNELAQFDSSTNHFVADTLHELGVLEVKKHSLDTAEKYLTRTLDLRRTLGQEYGGIDADCASTLHQLAAVHVARKPPLLDKAEELLKEALKLSRQVGQRAATLKLLARVTIRQGLLDTAESYLRKALELYVELYGERTNHINVAAVKFQQGALACQREQLKQAWIHFSECLRIRSQVYAYAKHNITGEDGADSKTTFPIHLEVSVVLHELGCVAYAQNRYPQSLKMLQAERDILENIEASVHAERLLQARLTNLPWLRKCAKEMCDEGAAAIYSTERANLKEETKIKAKQHANNENSESLTLQNEALRCRLILRQFALAKTEKAQKREHVLQKLDHLGQEVDRSRSSAMKAAAQNFHDEVSLCLRLDNAARSRPSILNACDTLRSVNYRCNLSFVIFVRNQLTTRFLCPCTG